MCSKAERHSRSKVQQQQSSSEQQQHRSSEVQQQHSSSEQQHSSGEVQQANTTAVIAPESRIINIQLLSRHIEDVTQHVATCSACHMVAQSSDVLTIFGEKDRKGLASIMGCRFKGCGQELTFNTSTKTTGLTGNVFWTNNLAAVWGQMTVGGGFNSLEESLSVLNIPVMTKRSFIHAEQVIGKWWWTALEESMKSAGKEEKSIAIKKGNYHQDVPAITVIVDAGWSKRTHKHSYNALSCVGVIFGKETQKLLYIGVRNKFCAVCEQGASKKHECFRNWTGSSSSMESDIILEGFSKAEQQHGVRYINFIGDGDSSVHTTLISGVRGWGHAITKQECANHAVKCYRSALENLVKDKPQYKGRHKLTEPQRKRLASSVRCAIIMRSKEVNENKVDKPKAAKALQEDILNSTLHCFGSHHKCKPEYCKTVRAMHSPTDATDSLGSNTVSFSGSDSSSSSIVSSDTSSDIIDLSSSFDDSSDGPSLGSPAFPEFNCEDTIEDDALTTLLLEQQTAWEAATNDVSDDVPVDSNLEPAVPLDQQMICDIQKIAGRLAAKASQLIGKLQQYNRTFLFIACSYISTMRCIVYVHAVYING